MDHQFCYLGRGVQREVIRNTSNFYSHQNANYISKVMFAKLVSQI